MKFFWAIFAFVCGIYGLVAIWLGTKLIMNGLIPDIRSDSTQSERRNSGLLALVLLAITIGSSYLMYRGAKVTGYDLLGLSGKPDDSQTYFPDR